MNLLLLTQIVPYPPDSGPKVKTYHVLRYLAGSGHSVTLVSFVRREEEQYVEYLKPYCSAIHAVPLHRSRPADLRAYAAGLRSGLPFLVTRDARAEMFRTVQQLVSGRPFDIIHADQLTMAQFALSQVDCRLPIADRPAIIFDAHNAVYKIMQRASRTALLPMRPVLALEASRIRRYEGMLVRQFDHTLAVSDIDCQALADAATCGANSESDIINLQSKISTVPIAVDCEQLAPIRRAAASSNILTMGTLYYPPNADGVRWFTRDVYPLVRSRVSHSSLTIVGPRPPRDLVQFAAQHSSHVTVTGYVPDLQPYVERAAVMVVPVRAGSGMRVRILEALARGVPVVTTSTGVEGIDAVNGEHLLVADEPDEFAAAVARVIENPELGRCLAENGRRLAREKYDWRAVLPRLESVYLSIGQLC